MLGSLVAESQQAQAASEEALEEEEADASTKKLLEVKDFYLYVCPEGQCGEARKYTAVSCSDAQHCSESACPS